jgi:hypothetical protein
MEPAAATLQQATLHLHDALVILVNVTGAARALSPPDAPSAPNEGAASWLLPDKTMYNIGLDAAASELVLLAPAGFRLSKSMLPLDANSLQRDAGVQVSDVLELVRRLSSRADHSSASHEELLSPAIVFPVLSSKKFNLDVYPTFKSGDAADPERCGAEQPESLQLPLESLESSQPQALVFNRHVGTPPPLSTAVPLSSDPIVLTTSTDTFACRT